MAYTTVKNTISFRYMDERDEVRNRTIELGGAVIFTDDDAIIMSAISKSGVMAYTASNKQVDNGQNIEVDSEVKDTARLYFLLDDQTQAHFDIVDPADELFLDTTGEGANIIRSVAQLLLVGGVPGVALDALILKIMAGDILISDGETPIKYLYGQRL